MDVTSGRLRNKVAVVTGTAPGGIGEAYARAMAAEGAAIVCCDLDRAAAEQVAGHIVQSRGTCVAAHVDVTSPESVEALMSFAAETFGGIDILINNAALMAQLPQVPILDYPLEEVERAFSVNFTGPLLCSRAAAPHMASRGAGRIVNQVSASAFPPASVYGITKLALVGLTTALAKELGPRQITVNAIAPGLVDSTAGLGLVPQGSTTREEIVRSNALGVSGRPNDLAGPLMMLVSEDGSWMTGQVIHVDGGWILRP